MEMCTGQDPAPNRWASWLCPIYILFGRICSEYRPRSGNFWASMLILELCESEPFSRRDLDVAGFVGTLEEGVMLILGHITG